jgi:hypothetical protein
MLHATSLHEKQNILPNCKNMKSDKFQNKYRIPSARAVWHNYNGGEYFITICTAGRVHYFGEVNNGEMALNALGQKLDELMKEISTHNPYTEISVYQIMPNHIHMIVCINGARTNAEGRNVTGRDADGSRDAVGSRDAACHVSTRKNAKMQNIAEQRGMLSTAMGSLKSALTKHANLNKIWLANAFSRSYYSQSERNEWHC